METDWKKKYDEALAKARAGKSLEEIFPELRESEDERIRKYIVKFVELEKGVNLPPDDADRMLSYLEKQKESLHISETCKENTDSFTDEDERIRKAVLKGIEYLEMDEGWDSIGDIDILDAKQWLEKQKEQKPAEWSEEDEKHRQNCLRLIKMKLDEKPYPYYADYSWLKSLRPQPKQEWSKEDEKILVAISKALGCDTAEKILVNEGVTLVMAAGFLESLRPSWKPSEEQMGMLLAVINDPNNAGAESCHLMLQSLFADLQKLL